eukprot:362156-Chlamydomonas_euryale.AAC.24
MRIQAPLSHRASTASRLSCASAVRTDPPAMIGRVLASSGRHAASAMLATSRQPRMVGAALSARGEWCAWVEEARMVGGLPSG